VPGSWPAFGIAWRFGTARYEIEVVNPEGRVRGVSNAELDGRPIDPSHIPLADDGRLHRVTVRMGASPEGADVAARQRLSPVLTG
jgi:hypothetical protein